MTERPWTSGPWTIVPYGDGDSLVIHVEGTDWRICFMATPGSSPRAMDTIEANAALIAAAPDLYEALEALLRIVESEFQVERDERPDGSHIAASVRGDWLQARAALARARGETL